VTNYVLRIITSDGHEQFIKASGVNKADARKKFQAGKFPIKGYKVETLRFGGAMTYAEYYPYIWQKTDWYRGYYSTFRFTPWEKIPSGVKSQIKENMIKDLPFLKYNR
jgi:hypothetical protein